MSSATAPASAEAALGLVVGQQFPVAVVGAGHGAGAHDRAEVGTAHAGHACHGGFKGELNLGQRGDGHPQRQFFVQHMVFAHIAVGQHVVAQLLAVARPAQWPSMIQACGRSTAMWSVMFLALAGPTPMLTMVMPLWSARPGGRRAFAAGAGGAPSSSPGSALKPTRRVTTLPGSMKAMYSLSGLAIPSWPRRTNSSM